LNRFYAKVRGKEDPYLKIGEVNDRTVRGGSEYVWALKDINFEVRRGEVLGIIGRNGAGKSTLLKILSQITRPTTGTVKMGGRVGSLLEVGTGFHPDLTGRENIYINGAILGMRRWEIARKLDEIIDFAGVEKYIDTPVKRYSSGMMVRLGFSVAAHLDPEIMIVDEVLAVGDIEFQKKCLGKLGDVSADQGRTILFVSHNMHSLKRLCHRGIFINNGSIELSGSVDDAIDRYMINDYDFKIINQSNYLKDFHKSSSSSFQQDQPVEIAVEFELLRDFKDIFCDVAIFNTLGYKISHLRMEKVSNFLELSAGRHCIRFLTESVKLAPDKYFAKLMIATRHKEQILLHVKDLFLFEVIGDSRDGTLIDINFSVDAKKI